MKLVAPLFAATALATNPACYDENTCQGQKSVQAHHHTHNSGASHESVPWQVDVDTQTSGTNFDPSLNRDYMSTGDEVIIPIDVHDQADAVATQFFNTINYYIKKDFHSWHDGEYLAANYPEIAGPYEYEAHYRGRDTAYYNQSNQATAGWNAIASDTGLQITWEGDLEACTNIKPTDDHSNQECSFDKANEYCHRHAGELFIPGEYYWHFFFNPMCAEIGSASLKSGANVLSATYSNSDYWVNLKREVQGNSLNLETTSKFHLYDQLDKNYNVYTGWNSQQEPVEVGANSNIHQQVIKTPAQMASINDPNSSYFNHTFVTLDEFRDLDFHQKICGDCNYNYDTSDQKAYANGYRDTLQNGIPHLNMKYISQHIQTGGYASKPCAKMYCGPDQTEPKVQDTMCDHNDIRPMCIIRNPLGYKAFCPKDLGIDQCGDNVVPVIVAQVYGSSATPSHEWNNVNGGDGDNNFIKDFAAVAEGMKAKLIAAGDITNPFLNYKSPTMYLNCLGTCTNNLGGVECDASAVSANQRQLCESHGIVYTGDSSAYKDPRGPCQCECTAPPAFTDPNALILTPGSFNTGENSVYCCTTGFTLVPDVGTSYTIDGNGCIVLECQDEFTTAAAQYTPFYEIDANQANRAAYWWSDFDIKNSIDATCVPSSCPPPPQVSTFNGDATGVVNGPVKTGYANAEVVTYPCPDTSCGTLSSECIASVNAGPGNGFWSPPTGTCVPKFCSAPAAGAHMTISVSGQMAHGGTFDVSCATGYALWSIVSDTRVNLNLATQTCDAFGQADCSTPIPLNYECRPIQCVDTNPCGNSLKHEVGMISSNTYDIGAKVTCDCLLNLQAQNQCESVCTFVDGDETQGIADTAEFQLTNCGCTEPECPAAADVPHGVAVNAGHEGGVVMTPYAGNKIQQGHFISYQCSAGYQLSFTHTDAPATWQQCIRECHTPISCSDPEGHGFPEVDEQRFPILDPLACYCKPTLCPKHDIATLPSYDYMNPGKAQDTHVSRQFMNTIDVVCKSRYFNRNGNRHETVNCDNGSWTTVDTCVELTCPDPRSVNNMSPSVNLEHTCKHLDTIDLNGNGNSEIIKDLAWPPKYGDTAGANGQQLTYGDPFNNDARYYIKNADIDIKEGTVQTFTCKPGFKPYLNFPAALAANNFAASARTSFDCTCSDGKWICSHSCRCDSYCPQI